MRGGKRAGAGRPRKDKSEIRPSHHIRAYEDEWKIIKEFIKVLRRKDSTKLKELIDLL